jgi:dihydrofolate reductase
VKLILTAFVTVDGVMEGPGHDEHRDGKNAWALRVQNEEDGWFNRSHVFSADAFLLGRKTYQIWAAFWPNRHRGRGVGEEDERDPQVRGVDHAQAPGLEQHHVDLG